MDIVRLGYETGIGGIYNVLRELCGEDVHPSKITLMGAEPAQKEPYEAFFACPVCFSPVTSSMSFSASLLMLPIRSEKRFLKQLFEQQAEAYLRSLPQTDSFLSAFQHVLDRGLKSGTPSINYVASMLGLSRVTLQRRLKDYHLTFQSTLDKTRLEMAKMYLKDPQLSLTDISMLLAFSEQSAFSRSFKRWTGRTPQQFRRHPD